MNLLERQDLKDFLVSLYGNQASDWPMMKKYLILLMN